MGAVHGDVFFLGRNPQGFDIKPTSKKCSLLSSTGIKLSREVSDLSEIKTWGECANALIGSNLYDENGNQSSSEKFAI